MSLLTKIILVVVGLINFYPIIGVISASQLTGLYGLDFSDPDLLILMRHRAVLLGLLGAFIITSAFVPKLRLTACAGGLISMITFIALAYAAGDYGEALGKVVIADIIASVGLVIVLLLRGRTTPDSV